MEDWQLNRRGLQLIIRGEPTDLRSSVALKRVRDLTSLKARQIIKTRRPSTFVVATAADDEALSLLRAEGQSYYVETTGETYVSPDLDARDISTQPLARTHASRNPFAKRASRIPRLLLLQPDRAFTVQELSREARVDKSLASRTVNALEAAGFVAVSHGPEDERFHHVRLISPRRLLQEWNVVSRRRTVARPTRLDIGTRTVEETLGAIQDAWVRSLPYAISGLAGAQFVRRVVEPADVLLLTTASAKQRWMELLLPRRPSQRAGLLRLDVIDDDFIFELARPEDGLIIADNVQLWLDTAAAGERAREASEAIAEVMHW
jgi:MarR family